MSQTSMMFSRTLKALELTDARCVATPKEPTMWGGPKASEISELRRMAKWREPPEEIKGEDELLTGEELKLFQSVAVQFHILAMDRVDLLSTVEESMRKMASPRAPDLACPQKNSPCHYQQSSNGRQISTDWIGQEK